MWLASEIRTTDPLTSGLGILRQLPKVFETGAAPSNDTEQCDVDCNTLTTADVSAGILSRSGPQSVRTTGLSVLLTNLTETEDTAE